MFSFYLRGVRISSNRLFAAFHCYFAISGELCLLLVCRCRANSEIRQLRSAVYCGFHGSYSPGTPIWSGGILLPFSRAGFNSASTCFSQGNVMHGNHHAVAVRTQSPYTAGNISIAFCSSAFAIPKIQNSCQIREVLLHHKGILYGIRTGAVLTNRGAATSPADKALLHAEYLPTRRFRRALQLR